MLNSLSIIVSVNMEMLILDLGIWKHLNVLLTSLLRKYKKPIKLLIINKNQYKQTPLQVIPNKKTKNGIMSMFVPDKIKTVSALISKKMMNNGMIILMTLIKLKMIKNYIKPVNKTKLKI